MLAKRSNLIRAWGAAVLSCALPAVAWSAHQTPTTTPIDLAGNVPYKMQLREVDFGAAQMPLLHSYAAAEHDGAGVVRHHAAAAARLNASFIVSAWPFCYPSSESGALRRAARPF